VEIKREELINGYNYGEDMIRITKEVNEELNK